jgi:hypothetical protein
MWLEMRGRARREIVLANAFAISLLRSPDAVYIYEETRRAK